MANRSKRFRLNWREFAEGIVVAAVMGGLTTMVFSIYQWANGVPDVDPFSRETVMLAVKGAVGGGITYLGAMFGIDGTKAKRTLNQKASKKTNYEAGEHGV